MLAHIFWVLKLCQASWYICFLQLILTQLCESCPSLQMRKLSTGTPHFWDGWGRGHSGIHLSVSIMKLQTLHSVWGKKKQTKEKQNKKNPENSAHRPCHCTYQKLEAILRRTTFPSRMISSHGGHCWVPRDFPPLCPGWSAGAGRPNSWLLPYMPLFLPQLSSWLTGVRKPRAGRPVLAEGSHTHLLNLALQGSVMRTLLKTHF